MRALALLVLVALPLAAEARSSREVSYAVAKVWPTAVRFLRVDAQVTITEKDEAAGYIVFELLDEKKTFRGALELVGATDADGRATTTIWLRIEERPSYMEDAMLDKLVKKLREELGLPPALDAN